MNISPKKIIVLSLIAGFVASAIPASAFTRLVRGSEGLGRASVNELASDDVAILPNNPFYFMIGFSNRVKGFFISDKFGEANFKLGIAGRQAGEVRKLIDWTSENDELLSSSLTQYSNSLLDFRAKLNSLKASDLSDAADADIADMTARILTQLRFVDDIRDLFTSSVDLATLGTIDQTLAESLRFIALNLGDVTSFGSRIVDLIVENSDAATAVRVIGILARLVQEVSGSGEANAFIAAIADARQTLIADLAAAIQAEAPVAMKSASSIAAFKVTPEETAGTTLTVTEIVDQLADETLRAEIYALVQ